MDVVSVISVPYSKAFGRALAASILVLTACAPLPPQGSGTAASAPASAPAAPPAPVVPPSPRVAGVQHIPVGGASGYRTEVVVTPPSQVCDFDAFTDGFQYGYASTWNRLVMDAARDPGKGAPVASAAAGVSIPTFDPASIHLQDERYKIEWNGDQRVNACASDGYLIGRIVGTHQASVDQKAGAGQ
jgi:hypothetical protein